MNGANRHGAPTQRPCSRSRRRLLAAAAALGAGATALAGHRFLSGRLGERSPVVVARAASYSIDLKSVLLRGLAELGVTSGEIGGRRVLLKPNLVEPHAGRGHINTHPLVVRAAVEAFLSLGAASVVVAEGSGHRRDTILVLEESGLAEILREDRIVFHDLNLGQTVVRPNAAGLSGLGSGLWLPAELLKADLVVSLAKLKTHHWAGATLSMKNLFGTMPGAVYGWPKNVLHWAGLEESIVDVAATVRPGLAIIDGVVGMEGDGPIMGDPVESGVILMGRDLAATDATGCRIMGIDPLKLGALQLAENRVGRVREPLIEQRGETIASVRRDFRLLDHIPAQRGVRL